MKFIIIDDLPFHQTKRVIDNNDAFYAKVNLKYSLFLWRVTIEKLVLSFENPLLNPLMRFKNSSCQLLIINKGCCTAKDNQE